MRVFGSDGCRLLTLAGVADVLGMSHDAARQARSRGKLPDPVGDLDGRTPLWRLSDVVLIPADLLAADRWVRFSAKKVPLTSAGLAASSTDPATWCSFESVASSDAGVGFGFVLSGDGIVCVDIDGCLVGGEPNDLAVRVLAAAGPTWVEVSPSGNGLHVWGRADVARGFVRRGVEVYPAGRYITVTGRRFGSSPLLLGDLSEVVASL